MYITTSELQEDPMRHTVKVQSRGKSIFIMLFCAVLSAAMFTACDPQQADKTGSLHLSFESSVRYQRQKHQPKRYFTSYHRHLFRQRRRSVRGKS